VPNLNAAVRRYGFILITLPLRHYAALPVPDANRPESWVLEAVRRQLEQHGFATRDLGLIEAILRAGHIALALDGTNEADRDLALAAFASQFPQVRLLVTSQAIPRSLAGGELWEVWELPADIEFAPWFFYSIKKEGTPHLSGLKDLYLGRAACDGHSTVRR
jgi:hypothetical protein